MWWGNRSIPGGYPPPGVSQRPSYAVHRLYIIIIRSFVCRCTSFVRCCTLFVRCCCLYVVVIQSFVHHRTLFIILCMLSYVVCMLSYVICTLSYTICLHLYVIIHCLSSFVRHPLYVIICHPCGNVPRNILENSLLVKDKKDERYKKTCLGPKQLLSLFGPAFLPVD
jgi:hypothetical protein